MNETPDELFIILISLYHIMPKLRGHHLVCLHFFSGEGYDHTFIDNLQDALKRLLSEELDIIAGGDSICRKCPYLKDDTCQYGDNADVEIREMDNKALELLGLTVGNSVSWHRIRNSIPKVFSDWFRCYCTDCEWLPVCEKNDDFRKVRPDDS